jgi:S1-C subfamily serine protease
MPQFFKQLFGIITLLVFSTSCGCASFGILSTMKDAPRTSFVKIEVITNEYISTGSGVIVNHIEEKTLILTAGHICKDNTVAMKVLDHYEKEYEVITFIRSNEDDLCVLVTDFISWPAIKVSNSEPEIGDKVYNIAAPMGIHAPDMSLTFEGHYQGQMKLKEEKHALDIHSISGMGGSSGSAIFNDKWQIIGIVSRGVTGFQHIMMCVSQARTKVFIDYTFTVAFQEELKVVLENKNQKLIDIIKSILK